MVIGLELFIEQTWGREFKWNRLSWGLTLPFSKLWSTQMFHLHSRTACRKRPNHWWLSSISQTHGIFPTRMAALQPVELMEVFKHTVKTLIRLADLSLCWAHRSYRTCPNHWWPSSISQTLGIFTARMAALQPVQLMKVFEHITKTLIRLWSADVDGHFSVLC